MSALGATVWIQGSQLGENSALAASDPARDRVLFVESLPQVAHGNTHRHKVALVLAAMRHRAGELRAEGWTVDEVRLESGVDFATAVAEHARRHHSTAIRVMQPMGWRAQEGLEAIAAAAGVPLDCTADVHFLCSRDDFRTWANGRRVLRMQEFYRWMRSRHGVLLDAEGGPEGGRWSYDPENRETFAAWRRRPDPEPLPGPPAIDRDDPILEAVQDEIDRVAPGLPGRREDFWLPVTRAGWHAWLDAFVADRLAAFGPFEDVSDPDDDLLAHAAVSPGLNLGLLRPRACVEAVESAYRAGRVPLASAEGFIRQVLGWREYVNGIYWLRMPEYATLNALDAHAPVPPVLTRDARSAMACVEYSAEKVDRLAWAHHIERLMIIGNLMLLLGTEPAAATRWFRERFADGADWVMQANVVGMALYADDGFMATKPYAGGGAYLKRMTGHCRGCRFDPGRRTGDDACPFTTLYWDFVARHETRLRANPRAARAALGWGRFDATEQQAILERAAEVRRAIATGAL